MRFLDKGEHLDLCLNTGSEVFCFAEHFDSYVEMLYPQNMLTSCFLKQLKKNPVIVSRDRYALDGEKELNLAKYLVNPNAVISLFDRNGEYYSIGVGEKFNDTYHMIGATKVELDGEFNMIYSHRNRTSLVMTLYHVCIGEEFTCEKLEEKEIHFSETEGFVLPCSEEEMKEFLMKDDGIILNQSEVFRKAVLDCYSYYPNYVNKFELFQGCFYFRSRDINDSVEIFFLHYWFSKPEYYNFAEACIHRDEKEQILKKNPYYTGVMPSANSLPHLNPKAEAYAKQMGFGKDVVRDLSDLEKNPKVGPNGLNIILEFVQKSVNANSNRDYEKHMTVCSNNMYWRVPQILIDIFNTFDISPKQFIDRTIRELFYNNMSAEDYWRCINDYAIMCEQLGMEVDKKIPKDVMHRHDILSTRVKEIRDEAIKQMFAIRVAENKKLLEHLPAGNLTIISPETSKDLVEEGFRMNHCVGTYSYSYASGSSKIFFVRNKANIDIPLATLELDHKNRLVQISANSNRRPDKVVLDFVNEWIEMIRKEGN